MLEVTPRGVAGQLMILRWLLIRIQATGLFPISVPEVSSAGGFIGFQRGEGVIGQTLPK